MQRLAGHRVEISSIIGHVTDKDVTVPDDAIARGPATLELPKHLGARKARWGRIACTHGLFAAGAAARAREQPDVIEIVCTNSVPIPPASRAQDHDPVDRQAAGRGEKRIHDGELVSALFHA